MAAKIRHSRQPARPAALTSAFAKITQGAFVLALAIVVARCTLLESLRDPFKVTPSNMPYLRAPGPATSIALDWLCCVPALLILGRRLLDQTYTLTWSWSQVLLLPLAAWMMLSVRWADDKFAALISVSNVIAAFALLWAAAQLVRTWLRLRIVAAISLGLLAVLVAHSVFYKFVEVPESRKAYAEIKKQRLEQNGGSENDYFQQQLEKKFMRGEILGFSASPNSLAAILVLLMLVAAGLIMQRFADGDARGWAVAIAIIVAGAAWVLAYTQSKAALATPLIGVLLFLIVWKYRRHLAEKSSNLFWAGVAIFLLGTSAAIGHGLYHHSLPTASLNFRWRYWTATGRMFLAHPIVGVGWENFGPHYLRYRLPAAAEEIKDPHNFIIRFFVELGLIGGVLMLAWLMRLWWELTRPAVPAPLLAMPTKSKSPVPRGNIVILGIAAISGLTILINTVASVDFSQDKYFIIVELTNRLIWICALMIGMLIAVLKSIERQKFDARPAPWVLYGILIAIGVFLIHNLIEFSIFEPGNLCLFALLAGAALGIRTPPPPIERRHTAAAGAVFIVAAIAWIAAACFVLYPTANGESLARDGDMALRDRRYLEASLAYQGAFDAQPIDADYALRAAGTLCMQAMDYTHVGRAAQLPADWQTLARSLFQRAAAADPSDIDIYMDRARFATDFSRDSAEIIDNFNKALQLNPNEVSTRVRYAAALAQLDRPAAAIEQYQLALKYNDELDTAEPKRLSAGEIEKIHVQIKSLMRLVD